MAPAPPSERCDHPSWRYSCRRRLLLAILLLVAMVDLVGAAAAQREMRRELRGAPAGRARLTAGRASNAMQQRSPPPRAQPPQRFLPTGLPADLGCSRLR
mmetsp:Transcript_47946/g.112075  ORF Transcript_47946/g.112075 Transcript_47946/m.112075 type:complete len:100 (-) Transcript_47946:126-425(-)